jgi:hypothetical protein
MDVGPEIFLCILDQQWLYFSLTEIVPSSSFWTRFKRVGSAEVSTSMDPLGLQANRIRKRKKERRNDLQAEDMGFRLIWWG